MQKSEQQLINELSLLKKDLEESREVLVIDDEPNLVELLQLRLEGNNFEVKTASNGVEGFALAKVFKPNLIVLDVSMPTMDGYAFIKEIKWHIELKDIPILILTAKSDLKDLFEDEGITNFMTKPFDSKELVSNIKKMCSQN